MAAVWFYGYWKGGDAFLIALPGGVFMAIFTAQALTLPVITMALVAVAFIYGIDAGWGNALRNAGAAVIVIGLALSGWNILVSLRGRRN